MTFRDEGKSIVSRRTFLRGLGWAPVAFLPAPLRLPVRVPSVASAVPANVSFPLADVRLTPHYPAKSPLDDVLRQVTPGSDEFVTEKYALEIGRILRPWADALRRGGFAERVAEKFLDVSVEGARLAGAKETAVRSGFGLEVLRRRFSGEVVAGRERPRLGNQPAYVAPSNLYRCSDGHVYLAAAFIEQIPPVVGPNGTVPAFF